MKPPFGLPDLDRPLVPDGLPWLQHTAAWTGLTAAERRRANQLMGLLVNELCLAVERGVIAVGLRRAARLPRQRRMLAALFADEARHARWFAAYNRAAAPGLYAAGDFRFLEPPRALVTLGRIVARLPGAWIACAWIALATEEWACNFARRVLADDDLDPAFRALHRAHLADEARHVADGRALLHAATARVPRALRRPLVTLARRAVAAAMRPRRAAPHLLAQLAEEFPRLRPELPRLVRAVRAVGRSDAYWRRPAVAAAWPACAAAARAWGAHWPAEGAADG